MIRFLAGALTALVLAAPAPASAQPEPAAQRLLFTPQELEQLVAPIALYPDSLLGHVLMASTYPFELVQAARWARDPRHASLGGEALRVVLADRDWDPSVKSLIPFPQVLQMMDSNLEWMQTLGDAFLAQPDDVMDAVQRLRRRALADGTLRSMDHYLVVVTGGYITIRFAGDDVVYVPYYDPMIVYGGWPYPAYPPYYFVPPPGYYVGAAIVPGFYFFAGPVRIVPWLWAWYRWDWRLHRIHLDVRRFNVINVRRPAVAREIWAHDNYHRRGVPYPTPTLRQRYLPRALSEPARRLDHRGYEPGDRALPRVAPQLRDTTPRTPSPRVTVPRPGTQPQSRPAPDASRAIPPAPRADGPRAIVPRATAPRATAPRTTAPARAPEQQARPATRAAPPAFQGYSSGADARREAERGRESRQAAPRARPEVRQREAPAREEAKTPTRSRPQPEEDSDTQPRSERIRR
jgi:hypothetical protein